MPWLNAFMAGYDLANAGIDAYEWYLARDRQVPFVPTADSSGPDGTGYYDDFTLNTDTHYEDEPVPVDGYFSLYAGIRQANIPTHARDTGPGQYSYLWSVYVYGFQVPYTTGQYVLTGAILSASIKDQALQLAPEILTPKIPYKLIPYVNPAPEPEAKPQPAPSGWFITNGPTPPDTTGFRDTPGREVKKQLTGAGAVAMRIAKKLINAATESCDAIDAMWDAVSAEARINYGYQYEKITYKRQPLQGVQKYKTVASADGLGPSKQVKVKPPLVKDALGRKVVESTRLSRISCTRKAKAFAQNPRLLDDIDWTKAINNLIVNQIEDAVFGFAGKTANDAFISQPGYNRPFGLGIGKVF